MPTAETLRALLALVEGAKAGSRELDAEIMLGLGLLTRENLLQDHMKYPIWRYIDEAAQARGGENVMVPLLTTSIDAALALVAKVLPGQDFTLHSNGTRWAPGEPAARIRFEPLTSVEETAPTLPLAILAALLRALLQQSETAHVER